MWCIQFIKRPTGWMGIADLKADPADVEKYQESGIFVDGKRTDAYPELFAAAQAIYEMDRVAQGGERSTAWNKLKMIQISSVERQTNKRGR